MKYQEILGTWHRKVLGIRVALYLYILENVDEQTQTIKGWQDKEVADALGMQCGTLQEHRRRLGSSGYISSHQGIYGLTVKLLPLPDLEQVNPNMWLYWMGNKEYDKIGVSRDVAKRFKQLQEGLPFEICIIEAVLLPARIALEKEEEIHRELDRCRLRGEWFAFDYPGIVQTSRLFGEASEELRSSTSGSNTEIAGEDENAMVYAVKRGKAPFLKGIEHR